MADHKTEEPVRYPFGTVGYYTHKGKEYPCVVVGLRDEGGYDLYHQGGLIFPARNQPLFARQSEFRPATTAARWLDKKEQSALEANA
jgi:hypothetical protein